MKPEQRGDDLTYALAYIGAPPSPGLIRQLDDPDPNHRIEAANQLNTVFGPAAKVAAPRLEAALNDPSPLIRVSMAAALASVDPANPRALSVLLASLDSTDLEVLEPAIAAIGELGPRAEVAVPKLKKIVGRNDLTDQRYDDERLEGTIDYCKISAAEALLAVAPRSGEGVSALLGLLKQGGDVSKKCVSINCTNWDPRPPPQSRPLRRSREIR